MKKFSAIMLAILLMLCTFSPLSALSAERVKAPSLENITFNNATVDQKFSSDVFDYTITLTNPALTPTLKSYKLSGSANIFVNYSVDDAKHQNGIIVTIEHNSGASYYNFRYSNAMTYVNSDNNYLLDVNCSIGEVYPKINQKSTEYKLYVPSDITEIKLLAVTQEVSALAEVPSTVTISAEQEPVIPITVTAANGDVRSYSFRVKRLKKSTEEVLAEMAKPDFKSIVYGELFYQKPAFAVGVIVSAGGIILLIVFIITAKKTMIKVGDSEEKDFFEIQ